MEKIDVLKQLKGAWTQLKDKQREINTIEKELKHHDPTVELTVWDNTQRRAQPKEKVYQILTPSDVDDRTRIIRQICETRHLVQTIMEKEFPEQAQGPVVGQTQNLLFTLLSR